MIKMLQYKMYPAGELRCPTTALVYYYWNALPLKREQIGVIFLGGVIHSSDLKVICPLFTIYNVCPKLSCTKWHMWTVQTRISSRLLPNVYTVCYSIVYFGKRLLKRQTLGTKVRNKVFKI